MSQSNVNRVQSAKGHMSVVVKPRDMTVSRNVSNGSDYFPMFAAEPAKPSRKQQNA